MMGKLSSLHLRMLKNPQNLGWLVRRMIPVSYTHLCAYTSLRAIAEIDKPERTSVCILVDKEEIGSVGATGAQSDFFEHVVTKLLDKQVGATLVNLHEALENSADVYKRQLWSSELRITIQYQYLCR